CQPPMPGSMPPSFKMTRHSRVSRSATDLSDCSKTPPLGLLQAFAHALSNLAELVGRHRVLWVVHVPACSALLVGAAHRKVEHPSLHLQRQSAVRRKSERGIARVEPRPAGTAKVVVAHQGVRAVKSGDGALDIAAVHAHGAAATRTGLGGPVFGAELGDG